MSKKLTQNQSSKSSQVLDSVTECPADSENAKNTPKAAKDYSSTVKHSFFKSRFGLHHQSSTAAQQDHTSKARNKRTKEPDLHKSVSAASRGNTVKVRKLRDALLTGTRSVDINNAPPSGNARGSPAAMNQLKPVKEVSPASQTANLTSTVILSNQASSQVSSSNALSMTLSTNLPSVATMNSNTSRATRTSDAAHPDSQTTVTTNSTAHSANVNANCLSGSSVQANPVEMAHFICYAITNHEDANYLLFWLSSLPLPTVLRSKRNKWLKLLDKTFFRPHSNMFLRGVASNNIHVENIQRYAHKHSPNDELLMVSLRALQSSVVPYIKTIIEDFTSQKVLGLIDTTNSLENVKTILKGNMHEVFVQMNQIFLLNLKLYRVNTHEKSVFFQSISTPTPHPNTNSNNNTSNSMGEQNHQPKKRGSQHQVPHLLNKHNEKTIDEEKDNFNFITTFSIANYMFYMGAGQHFVEEIIATSNCNRKRMQKCFDLSKPSPPHTETQNNEKQVNISCGSRSSASHYYPQVRTANVLVNPPGHASANSPQTSPKNSCYTVSSENLYILLAVPDYFESVQFKDSFANSNTEPPPSSVRDEPFGNSANTPTSYNRRRDNSTSLSTKGSALNLKEINSVKDSFFGLNAVGSVFFRSNRLMSQFSIDSPHKEGKMSRKKYTNTMKDKKYEEVDKNELYRLFDSIIDKPVVRFSEHLDLILNETDVSDTFRQAFPGASAKLSDTENKCYEFVYELYKTEIHYVRNLYILEKVYRFPLYELDLISKKVLNMLFINLDSLIGMHLIFLGDLHKIVSSFNDKLQLPVGEIYSLLSLGEDSDAGFNRSYCYLCSLQEHSIYELKNYISKYSTLKHYFMHTESLQIMKRLKFIDIKASIYQRLCGYELLLKGILKNNEHGTAEQNSTLQKCIGKIQDVLRNVNGSIEEYRNYLSFRFLERQINWKSSEATSNEAFSEVLSKYVSTPKKFIMQAKLEWRLGKNKTREICMVLTDKYLLLLHLFESEFMGPNDQRYNFIFPHTSVVMGKVTMKQELLPIVELSDIMAREVAADPLCFYVIVVSKSKMNQIYHIRATSVEEQKQWTQAINKEAGREKQGLPFDSKLNITYLMNFINEHTELEQQRAGSETKTDADADNEESYAYDKAAVEEIVIRAKPKKKVGLKQKHSLIVTSKNPRPIFTKARASSIHPRPTVDSNTDDLYTSNIVIEEDDADIKPSRPLPKTEQLARQGRYRRVYRSLSTEVPFQFMTHRQHAFYAKKVEQFLEDNKEKCSRDSLDILGKEMTHRTFMQRFYTLNSDAFVNRSPLKKPNQS